MPQPRMNRVFRFKNIHNGHQHSIISKREFLLFSYALPILWRTQMTYVYVDVSEFRALYFTHMYLNEYAVFHCNFVGGIGEKKVLTFWLSTAIRPCLFAFILIKLLNIIWNVECWSTHMVSVTTSVCVSRWWQWPIWSKWWICRWPTCVWTTKMTTNCHNVNTINSYDTWMNDAHANKKCIRTTKAFVCCAAYSYNRRHIALRSCADTTIIISIELLMIYQSILANR